MSAGLILPMPYSHSSTVCQCLY